ncbi:restriction endonuclease subunit S [Pseudoflavonifractor capillosus]|uniref:restriction endonuclease subunit S n=1 Tax=Pseudoflavonifractor capillosus TaxID=106588 RepID=UPI0019587AE2|nr:restriction endonuclease subunit S [Pseudoflavonifractor capillosus]MBM6693667.1 restriction endonuclease subunit S [Pseudoflavonifractor capillosus]
MKCNTTIRFLRDIADIQTGPFGSQLHKEDYVEYGTPIVTVEHLGNRKFTEQNLPKVSDSDKERLKKYVLATGDIVFSRVGSVDRCSYVDEEHNGWMFSGRCLRVRPSENIDSLYLYYYFCREETRQFVRNIAVGATMPSINTKLLGEVPVAVPDLQIQKMVSNILSTIDNKIELNNKINANLQQQAQAIFKSWFVDFEPFQDGEFVESELGPIPKGWSVGRLADICTYGKDKVAVSELTPENYFSTENMLANKGGYTSAASLPNVLQTARCVPGDTLVSNIRPYFKKIVYCMMNAGCSTDVLCLRPKHPQYSTYLYNLAYSDAFFDYMVAGSKGTKMPRGDKQQIMGYPVILPPDEVIAKFYEFADAVLKKNWVASEENKKLTVLRDSLLPKLMSGELFLNEEVGS